MTQRTLARTALLLGFALCATPLGAQSTTIPPVPSWREEAAGIGTTARVLIIGAHPDDEDNALIAWLSLGRHVETAYLSLTRGENGVNVNRREGQMLLGMVRTAEILAERKRDQAHQYFTRAYDFGHAKNDSAVWAAWPRDSLLEDVVTVIRAFRPQVVISLFAGDSADRDSQHHVADTLARAAVSLAADSVQYPPARTSVLGPWSVGAFYRLVDSGSASSLRINVGEIDVDRGRSYAEIGAEIRTLQRTQPTEPAPRFGASYRYLRRDWVAADANSSTRIDAPASRSLFVTDTGWTRFAELSVPDSVRWALDSMMAATRRPDAQRTSDEAVAEQLTRFVRLATRARNGIGCGGVAAVACRGALGDLALSLATTRDRATRTLLHANAVVVDVIADRDAVAVGDSVGISAFVYNGGRAPVFISRVSVEGIGMIGFANSDSATVFPDSIGTWRGFLKMRTTSYPWWSRTGLMLGTWMYDYMPPPRSVIKEQLIAGEDRIPSTSAFVTLRVGDAEMMTKVAPVVARNETTLRGDERRPVAAVPRLSVLLERGREYAAALSPFERLYRVWVGSSISHDDTVTVAMDLLPGLKTDSATRVIVLPAFGAKTLFFRVRGRWPIGQFPIQVSATERAENGMVARRPIPVTGKSPIRVNTDVVTTNSGMLVFEYPHIATQRYARNATDSVQSVPLRLPPKLRVAIVRTSHDNELESRIVELGVPAYTIDASTIGIADLSYYSTLLIAPRAYAEVDALLPNASAVRQFAERGGTVVVLRGKDELSAPGVLPFPIAFAPSDSITAVDPTAPVALVSPRSTLLDWPNRITSADFADWVGSRAHDLPMGFDPHYRRVIEINDDRGHPTDAAILTARVGSGMFIYTALSLDEQLLATNPGAARLLVNLLSATLRGP